MWPPFKRVEAQPAGRANVYLTKACFGLSRLYIEDTERHHESTRVLDLVGNSFLCTFTIYQQLELPKAAAEH